ncbi:unnamed protein product [Haemonchus placei]|uniref:Reverse transcriptase domain-containing protein n=1 Tax=Haemonchus placei TaxID=6290 RepID=A0A0N4WGP8_HAEPC|nr:unnamed protein product [Haemonchus placei]
MKFKKRSLKTFINWDHFASLASEWEGSVIDNINEEYNRLVKHLLDNDRKAGSLQASKRRLSSKTVELIRQQGIARVAGNHQQLSEYAKLCREAIKEDLKDKRAAVMGEAADAGKSIRKARRSFANYKTKMTSLRRCDGTVTASRRAMEKVIYDFYLDLFDSHVYLPTHHAGQNEYIVPSVLPSEIRHAIMSMKSCTEPGPVRIKPEYLKSLPPLIVGTLAILFTRYLSECKVPTSWKTSKTTTSCYITPNIEQVERMLADFGSDCGKIGFRLNLTKTMFMKYGLVPNARFTLNGTNISECSSYVYLGREVNIMNGLAPELCRRKRVPWRAFKNIEGALKKKKDVRLRAPLFDTAVLPALTCALET